MSNIMLIENQHIQESIEVTVGRPTTSPMTFVLFGATGDLSRRKIFPTLYNLFLDNKLPETFSIICIGRREWSNATLRKQVKESLKSFSRRLYDDHSRLEKFVRYFCYKSLDVTDFNGYMELFKKIKLREEELGIPENRLFYLSVSPKFFDIVASNLQKSGISDTKGWKRLIIEKPFGNDLKSARELNKKLSAVFKESEIYRIDHYLGKSMIQNLEALKFANPLFHTIWNSKYIANVQITASETVGVEDRANFYDQVGSIRDMFQNHMIQMLMMTAMQIPDYISPENIHSEKIKVMKSLRPLCKENIGLNVVRGQYSAGKVNGKKVIGYKEETGVNQNSTNDTFVSARLWIDSPVWYGVPFYIRTGKRMKEKSTRIVIEFKDTAKELYINRKENLAPSLLEIEVGPNEAITWYLNLRNALNNGNIEPIPISFSSDSKKVPEAYEVLIYDALKGDKTFFAHWNEVELSWAWIQVILDAFNANLVPLHSYEAGTMGPNASNYLIEQDGFKWW